MDAMLAVVLPTYALMRFDAGQRRTDGGGLTDTEESPG